MIQRHWESSHSDLLVTDVGESPNFGHELCWCNTNKIIKMTKILWKSAWSLWHENDFFKVMCPQECCKPIRSELQFSKLNCIRFSSLVRNPFRTFSAYRSRFWSTLKSGRTIVGKSHHKNCYRRSTWTFDYLKAWST